MNQATKTMLLAQALADVTKRIESFMDFNATKAEGHVYMAEAAAQLGLSMEEGRKAYDRGFPEFKEQLLVSVRRMAEVEMTQAEHEADMERLEHDMRLTDLRRSHETTMAMLAEREKSAIPQDADDEFAKLINDSSQKLRLSAQTFFDDMMKLVQMKHRIVLEHCFTGHLVAEETAKKLVELYEVK